MNAPAGLHAFPVAPATQTRIGFRVHPQLPWLVLPIGMAAQQALDHALAPLPNVEPWLRGVLNLRGNLVPVFDIGLWQGLGAQPASAQVLVLTPGPEAMAVTCCESPKLIAVQPVGAVADDDPMATWSTSQLFFDEGNVYEFDPQVWLRRFGRLVPRRN